METRGNAPNQRGAGAGSDVAKQRIDEEVQRRRANKERQVSGSRDRGAGAERDQGSRFQRGAQGRSQASRASGRPAERSGRYESPRGRR